MTENETQQARGISSSNAYFNNEGVIKLRLDTKPLLDDLELFLRGEIIEISRDPKTQRPIEQRIKIGEKKANDKGIQALMSRMTAILNPAVVQGNFTPEMYEDFIFIVRLELNEMLFVNRVEWDINTRDHNTIIDQILNVVEPYISRLIDNKERESYSQTIKTTESATLEKEKKGFLPW